MSRKAKTINIILGCIWMGLIVLLLYRNYTGSVMSGSQKIQKHIRRTAQWYAIYRQGEKIGLAKTVLKKTGKDLIVEHERRLGGGNNDSSAYVFRLQAYSTQDFSIKSFEYASGYENGRQTRIRGEVDKETIIFFIKKGEKIGTVKIRNNGSSIFFPVNAMLNIVASRPAAKTVFRTLVLDPTSFTVKSVRTVIEDIIPVKAGINTYSIYKIKMGNSTVWCNEQGHIIKERLPNGITIYSENELLANDPVDRIVFDYPAVVPVGTDQRLHDPEKIRTLKVKIHGFEPAPSIYSNSSVRMTSAGLVITKESRESVRERTFKLPYREGLDKYLSSDRWIKYDSVLHTAMVYSRSKDNDAFQLAYYLTSYIFNLIRTNPSFFLHDTADVLKSLSGDYLERTVMFASYARAAGLPTRLVGGLVYRKGYFYFHTWPEVWLDGWVPVDPTFFQFPADATHIPLVEGTLDEIVSIVEDLKTVKIEILEAS